MNTYLTIDAMASGENAISRANSRAATRTMADRKWAINGASYTDCLTAAREISRDYAGTMVRVHLHDITHRESGESVQAIAYYSAGLRVR